jgi:N6-L-threonylcarbamoyladenine synthase
VPGLDYSFSGLKTSFLYHVRDHLAINPEYINENKAHLAAAMQRAIIDSLLVKLKMASDETGIRHIAMAGGVSANSELRETMVQAGRDENWKVYIPEFRYTTDNAAMIGIAAWFKLQEGLFANQEVTPYANSLSS